MSRGQRLLVVSPHLDDAVLSVGAALDMLSGIAGITVVTVFAGTPTSTDSEVARAFHRKCGFVDGRDAMRRRRHEDARALSFLGVDYVHLDLQDAIFRVDGDGAPRVHHEDELFRGRVDGGDREVVDQVAAELGRLVSATCPAVLWTCAGIGGHVDHLVTAGAARHAGLEAGVPVHHWEDLPYALEPAHRVPDEDVLATCRTGPRHLARKVAAVGLYESQVRVLWPGARADLTRVFARQGRRDRATGEYAERFVRFAAG